MYILRVSSSAFVPPLFRLFYDGYFIGCCGLTVYLFQHFEILFHFIFTLCSLTSDVQLSITNILSHTHNTFIIYILKQMSFFYKKGNELGDAVGKMGSESGRTWGSSGEFIQSKHITFSKS